MTVSALHANAHYGAWLYVSLCRSEPHVSEFIQVEFKELKFLLKIIVSLSPQMDPDERKAILSSEMDCAKEHTAAGRLIHIWRIAAQQGNWSVWEVADATALHAIVSQLPLFPWMKIDVHPLAEHPLLTDFRSEP